MQKKESILEERLFKMSIEWLRRVEPRDFYQRVVEFCATVMESEVCAIFIKTMQIDSCPRVCLVAGKLPPDHPKGLRMDPKEVGHHPKDHSYRITSDVAAKPVPLIVILSPTSPESALSFISGSTVKIVKTHLGGEAELSSTHISCCPAGH